MARLRPLARHSGSHSDSAREADSTRAAGRIVQVERGHSVTGTASSTNDIIPEPGSDPVRSVDGLGSLSPHAAGYAGTDTPIAPAVCPTGNSIDFCADRHPDGD
jgi:hypothetical protein